MADVNYPDVLGAITGGARLSVGAAAFALAARPAQIAPGSTFDVMLLAQNASDAMLEVTAIVRLPDTGARRQRGRFLAAADRLTFTLQPGECGCALLPAAVHHETAPGSDYRFTAEIDVKLDKTIKPRRLRLPNGGTFDPASVNEAARGRIRGLRPLAFSAMKKTANNRLDAPIVIAGSGAPLPADPFSGRKPSYNIVCGLADFEDERWLLHTFSGLIANRTLPALKRAALMPALAEATRARFAAAGLPLDPAEVVMIAKLLTILLEYASAENTGHGYQQAGRFALVPLLGKDPLARTDRAPLPHWLRALLRAAARDERAALYPIQAAARMVYPALVRDAIEYGFELFDANTGEDIGSADEMKDYIDTIVARLTPAAAPDARPPLVIDQAYLPLIMGGIIINELLLVPMEDPADALKQASLTLDKRWHELRDTLDDDTISLSDPGAIDPDIAPVFAMTSTLLGRTAQKYGYRL